MAIPSIVPREVTSGGVLRESHFGISQREGDEAHVIQILRDKIYKDKVLAVIREYSSNAWDAHREAKKPDDPIHVTLPTEMEPTFTVEDHGLGLSPDDVLFFYTQYGASSRRTTNDGVGMLGIGCKAGFSYSSSWTIISRHAGTKSIYAAVIDASQKGIVQLLHEEACGDETGITIQIPVRAADIPLFYDRAKNLFAYFEPRPIINTDIPEPDHEQVRLQHGSVQLQPYMRGSWAALMGCVLYPVDMERVWEGLAVPPYVKHLSGILRFPISDVTFTVSREDLEYTDNTKEKIAEKILLLADEFVAYTVKKIEGTCTPWEKRLQAQTLRNFHLPIPASYESLAEEFFKLSSLDAGDWRFRLFSLRYEHRKWRKDPAALLPIDEDTRLVLRDDTRSLRGFELKTDYILVYPKQGVRIETAEADLKEQITAWGLDGIPVTRLSTIPWQNPSSRSDSGQPNIKHRVSCFQLHANDYFGKPYSKNWDVVSREPTTEDIFVILTNFKSYDFYKNYREDKALADAFEKTMPAVYGYKNTNKKPVRERDCLGTPYRTWRKEFHRSLLSSEELDKALALAEWACAFDSVHLTETAQLQLEERLGKDHFICRLTNRSLNARKTLHARYDSGVENHLRTLRRVLEDSASRTDAHEALGTIYARYPLLGYKTDSYWSCSLRMLIDKRYEPWVQYVHLIDAAEKERELS